MIKKIVALSFLVFSAQAEVAVEPCDFVKALITECADKSNGMSAQELEAVLLEAVEALEDAEYKEVLKAHIRTYMQQIIPQEASVEVEA